MKNYEQLQSGIQAGTHAVITDIQRFTVHDGPGIRTMIFFKGCPLRCQWCQNPETWHRKPELMYYKDQCIGCGNCQKNCSTGALSLAPEGIQINPSVCTQCGNCAEVCYPEALKVSGKVMALDQVYEAAISDKMFYDTSGGGVTLSGGECTTYARFISILLGKLQSAGIHTAIETCGYCTWDTLQEIVRHLDLVLFDIKVPHPSLSKIYTGQGFALIEQNLARIRQMNVPVILRYPMIPGINDTPEMLGRISELAKQNKIQEVHLLPFHQMGAGKWAALHQDYALDQKAEPTEDEIERAYTALKKHGLLVSIGGSGNVA